MLATVLVTGALYGFCAWSEWWARITLYNRDLAVNEVNLRMLVAGVDQQRPRADARAAADLRARRRSPPSSLVVLAARDRPLEEAMLLGLPLALVLLHPVNYQDHFVFLLVLLGARPAGSACSPRRRRCW